jgi:cytochrome bd-type quinol oxidase subunit 2
LATGVLVSGFPAVLQATTQQANTAALGDLIFAVTLARAPLIVTVMALQSFLVVQFRNSPDSRRRRLIQISALVSGLTVAASAVTAVIGIPVLNFVANHVVVDNVVFTVGLVFSSGLVALLQVTGAFLIAESRHTAYFVGLALAACATVALLQADLSLTERVTLSLIGAPALGLVSHLLALIVRPTKTPAE